MTPMTVGLIFGAVCMVFAAFPPPIREGIDPTLARIALAVLVTLLIEALVDFGVGFRNGWKRSRARRSNQ
jgi:O-antigen/teichoic acid export membrane protein